MNPSHWICVRVTSGANCANSHVSRANTGHFVARTHTHTHAPHVRIRTVHIAIDSHRGVRRSFQVFWPSIRLACIANDNSHGVDHVGISHAGTKIAEIFLILLLDQWLVTSIRCLHRQLN